MTKDSLYIYFQSQVQGYKPKNKRKHLNLEICQQTSIKKVRQNDEYARQ